MVSNGYEHFEEDYRQECDFIRQDSNYDDLCKESEAFDNWKSRSTVYYCSGRS
ncbi:MAG: hypothetical protein ACLSA6_06635 [Holdemania massiliensis]